MATERQIQANRANPKRSTGPVTEEGKQTSSQNARRHDQLSSCIVLKAEYTSEFDELMNSLIDEFQPQTANETAPIETTAASRWKLTRNWIWHTALLEVEIVKQDHSIGSDPVIAALAFKSLADNSHSLHLLHRYEVSLDRQYSRALNNLLKARAAGNSRGNRRANRRPAASLHRTSHPRPDLSEEVETPPGQEFPNEANLPRQSARKPVDILRHRPVSVLATTSRTPKHPDPAPETESSTPPRTK